MSTRLDEAKTIMSEEHEEILDRVRVIAEPLISASGMELVDLELVGGRGNYILRVLIEKPSKVTLQDCVTINRELSDIMDVEDPIPYKYTLEVSSPGLDRPFKYVRDYNRALGKLVRITTQIPVEGKMEHIGRLEDCSDKVVTLLVDDKPRQIPLKDITKALRELVW
ncbi:MAG: ribosome maturation factor RimP [Candidatus Latescibacteria bacterium]|nr:ribosome maturation factor RimP [Candidatus Latescibacterota bacterium]